MHNIIKWHNFASEVKNEQRHKRGAISGIGLGIFIVFGMALFLPYVFVAIILFSLMLSENKKRGK